MRQLLIESLALAVAGSGLGWMLARGISSRRALGARFNSAFDMRRVSGGSLPVDRRLADASRRTTPPDLQSPPQSSRYGLSAITDFYDIEVHAVLAATNLESNRRPNSFQ
jgi:hypothetical protein